MKKTNQYMVNGAFIGAAANGLLNILKQTLEDDEKPFNWRALGWAVFKGGVIGGSIGLTVGSIKDYYNEQEMPVNTDKPIMEVVNQNRLLKTDPAYQRLKEKADWVASLLKKEYGILLKTNPYYFGSTEKDIALKSDFDIDMAADFRKKSFSSTGELRDDILAFMESYLGKNGLCGIRDQRVSIGLRFLINGKIQRVDILPNKLSYTKGNNGSGYVYVNNSGLFERSSYTKTNPKLLQNIPLSKGQKDILVALKIWKLKNNIPARSHLLQCMVIDAYQMNKGNLPRTFSEKIILVLNHIVENIDAPLCSIENSNNIVTDISETNRDAIIAACEKVIKDYEYQPNSILTHFVK
jgi:hypothetical protein